jgi:phosphate transport system substrate-binding protein
MKNLKYTSLAALLVLLAFTSYSQTKENGKVLISGTRFTYPLVEKWISEFNKTYPDVEVRILPRKSSKEDSANLVINAHQINPENLKPGYEYINIGRYALLAISNSNNPANEKWLKKGLKESEVKKLFFEDANYFESENTKNKKKEKDFQPTVYTREEKACAPIAFANHYGFQQENIKGKGVSGDDKYLIYALKKDSSAITYNNPGYVFDLKTRTVVPGITIIPYDLNENGKVDEDENFYSDLDQLIQNAESNKSGALPVEHVNISYPKQFNSSNNNIKLFLDFVLREGQKFNHEYGFLNLDNDLLAKQKALLLGAK